MNPLLSALVTAGLIPSADAERIDRQLDPDAARIYGEGLLTNAFRRGLFAQQRRILELVNSTQGQPTVNHLHRFWQNEDPLLWASVQEEILSLAGEHAVVASISAGPDTWRLVNEAVIEWAETYYLSTDVAAVGSIPNLNVTSRTAFSNAFRDWQRGALAAEGIEGGMPQLIAALQPTFGATRATRIGVTETTRVFSESERAGGEANDMIVGWIYSTANDALVSEFCRGANGLVMLKGQSTFPDGRGFPPRHVNCRSAVTQISQGAYDALVTDGIARTTA